MPKINPLRLKYWRQKKHLSLVDLAEKSAVDKATIHRIERSTSMKQV
ncbi:helix-turn-helix domain-containing protein [Myxococcus sp. RHSTA-1-4]|nr:helix-turn-helix transcriptional regulator [Myxococcus sp. RHSTA-1-4]MBZ4416847.1 helix-turn-helix domain-containing protein [Myxococcus sp. RHSTA-1-4]